jgi:hypothetical protein
MAIFQGSRYEYATIDYLSTNADEDAYPVVFYEFLDINLIQFFEHTYVDGERLDQIAFRYYNKPGTWWYIVESNPEITDIFNIAPGTVLRIPNV